MRIKNALWKNLVLFLVLLGTGFADEPNELAVLKREFKSSPDKNTEAGREKNIVDLIHLEEKYDKVYRASGKREGGDDGWSVNLEIVNHPAPKDYNPSPSLLLGDWKSDRHGYRYTSDGKWIMLPEDTGTTHGKWKITKDEFFESVAMEGDKIDSSSGSPIYLLNRDYFVYGSQTGVYILKRVPDGTYGKD